MYHMWTLTIFTLLTRFHNLAVPEYVCWDEVHYGKMAGGYLNRTYFIDAHPPLGKMIIAVAGRLTGYDGWFSFANHGDAYNTSHWKVHYFGMRATSATLGSLTISLLHHTVKRLTGSQLAAFLSSALMIFDCGLLTLSQYILVDPILLFFMSAAIYCKAESSNKLSSLKLSSKFKRVPFAMIPWCRDMLLCGLCLGCAVSVKWNGIFTALFICLWTVWDVWSCGKATILATICLLLGSAIFLVILPFLVYVSTFVVHYEVLNRSGTGDGFHSSLFQSCLKENALHNTSMPPHVAYGSIISVKFHQPLRSGLLHSHDRLYPVNVMPFPYQQATLNFHKDANNFWEVVYPSEEEMRYFAEESYRNESGAEVQLLKSGNFLRLRHAQTGCYLHSHVRKAALTPYDQIVSCHKNSLHEAKLNEIWRLDIADVTDDANTLGCLNTRFLLVHANTGCALRSTFKVLPDWGLNQYEVTCTNNQQISERSMWNVEQHAHKKLNNEPVAPCQVSFWDRFTESHAAMAALHLHFTPTDLSQTSRAWQWPIYTKGQVLTEDEHGIRVYLFGNPIVFYINIWSLAIVFILSASRHLKFKPNNPKLYAYKNYFSHIFECTDPLHFQYCQLFILAWALNYLPFLVMPQVVYFHHYYPAMLCNCCLSGCFYNMIFEGASVRLSQSCNYKFSCLFFERFFITVYVFCLFVPFYLYFSLAYGVPSSSYNY